MTTIQKTLLITELLATDVLVAAIVS